MSKYRNQNIFQKYPSLFKLFLLSQKYQETKDESLKASFMGRLVWPGISCGDGWYDLIDNLSAKLEALILEQPEEERDKFCAVQVKEKFGGLRFYLDHEIDEMSAAIGEAESISFKTCEVCGELGEQRGGGWIKVLCDKHFLVDRAARIWGYAKPGTRGTVYKGKNGPNTTEETISYRGFEKTLPAQQEEGSEIEREVLYENKWVSLVKLDGWNISTEQTRGKGSALVAVLGYRKTDAPYMEYVGRFEWTPSHSDSREPELCALTGAVESDDIAMDALRELVEEAGVSKTKNDLIYLGTCNPHKSDCATTYLFAVECEEIGEAHGDGSHGEHNAFCRWVSEDILVTCKDPTVHTMMVRLKALLD